MLNGKSWAMLAAVAAVAIGGVARAESVSAGSSSESFSLQKPVTLQAAPVRKPLMQGLDAIGLAKPLEDAGITIGGYASASLTYYPDTNGSKVQAGRSFDSEEQDPTINQIGVFVERTVDVTKGKFDLGGRVEWIWGSDARFIHSTGLFDYQGLTDGPENQFDPVQVYADVAIPVGNGLRVRVGKFITPAGVETINPTTNALYSRGLLFNSLLPGTHTGVVGSYAVSESLTLDLGVIRGWDDALEDKNADGVSFLGAAYYSFADKKTKLNVVVISGPEYVDDTTATRSLVDVVLTHKLSDEWSFAVQGDFLWETDVDSSGPSSDDGFAAGLGGWASYKFSQYVTVNGRLEYLYDGQGLRFSAPEGNNVYSATLGLTVTPFPTNDIGSNLKIRPEMRYDYAEAAVFGGDNNQLSFAIEGYFTF